MKVLVGIVFGVLTALAIAAGVYIWMEMGEKHEDFFSERKGLEQEISGLKTDLGDWNGTPDDKASITQIIDSLEDTLDALEPVLEELLSKKGLLSEETSLNLAEPHDAASWRFYPFLLEVEEERVKVDSFIADLYHKLPVINLDHLYADWKGQKVKLTLVGTARFPEPVKN